MRQAALSPLLAFGVTLSIASVCGAQPFPSSGAPNPAMVGASNAGEAVNLPAANPSPAITPVTPPLPAGIAAKASAVVTAATSPEAPDSPPRAVTIARATAIPRCTVFVDAATSVGGDGTSQRPHKTMTAAVAAAPAGAVICVAEGMYPDQLKPGEKYFTLAGGFQRGQDFKVRDSARYISKAQGRGGSFVRIEDPGPKGDQLTAIDGFEITGYAQAVFRDIYYSQRFDLTNNHIHDNICPDKGAERIVGAGFVLNNISGRIDGNVFRKNACGRGGAGALNDDAKENAVTITRNLVDNNSGTTAGDSHGGAFYFFGKKLTIAGNLFTNNSVTRWGAGLYVGAWPPGGYFTTATLSWNIYRGNRAGTAGGGMFCDDGANCTSYHEVYDRNCGGNIYLDGGNEANDPTISRLEHLTVVGGLDADCKGPGPGVRIDRGNRAPDSHTIINALFWGNSPDIAASCEGPCGNMKVNVSHSMVDINYLSQGLKVTFGEGIVAPVDPQFADAPNGDFHLKSAAGRWTPAGYIQDFSDKPPPLPKAFPGNSAANNPERAGKAQRTWRLRQQP